MRYITSGARARLCARRHEMVACGALKGHRVRGPRARHHAIAQVPPGPTGSLVYCNESLASGTCANTPRVLCIYMRRRRRVHFKYTPVNHDAAYSCVRKIHGRCRHEPRADLHFPTLKCTERLRGFLFFYSVDAQEILLHF